MKRLAWVILAAGLVGCAHKQAAPTTTLAMDIPTTAPSTAPAAPMTIFEQIDNGKIYVFGNADDLAAFGAGKRQALEVERPDLNPGKKPVVIEAMDKDEADCIAAGYCKLHPIAK